MLSFFSICLVANTLKETKWFFQYVNVNLWCLASTIMPEASLDLVITKGLTEEEKNRFHKYFLHGYSISELAQLEKISENNMSVRISRLRSKIAQNIPDESGIDKKYKKSV